MTGSGPQRGLSLKYVLAHESLAPGVTRIFYRIKSDKILPGPPQILSFIRSGDLIKTTFIQIGKLEILIENFILGGRQAAQTGEFTLNFTAAGAFFQKCKIYPKFYPKKIILSKIYPKKRTSLVTKRVFTLRIFYPIG